MVYARLSKLSAGPPADEALRGKMARAVARLQALRQLLENPPPGAVPPALVDPLDVCHILTDRWLSSEALAALAGRWAASHNGQYLFHSPTTMLFAPEPEDLTSRAAYDAALGRFIRTTVAQSATSDDSAYFLKSRDACSTPASHRLSIFRAGAVADAQPGAWLSEEFTLTAEDDGQRTLQLGVPHQPALLWKAYAVAGAVASIVPRPSVDLASAGSPLAREPILHLDSQRLSRETVPLDPGVVVALTPEQQARVEQTVAYLAAEMGVSLFGVDIVFEEGTDRMFIVDLNYFPGYGGVDNLFPLLEEQLLHAARDRCT
ncbi:hypothetical protein, variant [Fonticula alba]|nr:hypothetical protein, variant [Fonticula alba]KCV68258.1 hypothetical protein, variant [Fonticula alba]|eukprot:XP_009497312.1 hypothetical protein, variant [Fonticula alba]